MSVAVHRPGKRRPEIARWASTWKWHAWFTALSLWGCAGRTVPPAATGPSSASAASSVSSIQRDETHEASAATAGAVSSNAGAYATVRGIRLYYETHGPARGIPLVMLPGGGSTIDASYGVLLPLLAKTHRVIAIEEQNHGRSEHRNQPERFNDSADDVAALLAQLGLTQVDMMGFSNGATIALHVEVHHPGLVRKLVFASGLTKKSGAPEQFWQAMRRGTFEDMPQELKDSFLAVNPDPAQLRDMYEKDAERMRSFVDIPDARVAAVTSEVLILGGDRDVATLDHFVTLSRLLPKASLAILPGGHGDYLGDARASTDNAPYPASTLGLLEAFIKP